MGSAADQVMNDIGEVEKVLNDKLIDVLTAVATGPLNSIILTPPFVEANIFLDNEQVTIPEATVDLEYIEFVVNYGGSVKSTKNVYNRIGIATASVFTPLGKGSKRSGDIYNVIQKTMQGVKYVSEVMQITTVDINKIGKSGGMNQTSIDVNFQYFE